MGGGDNRSLAVYEFEKIQSLTVGDRLRLGEISAIIGCSSGYSDGHVRGWFGGRNRVDPVDYVFSPAVKFALKLLDQGHRALSTGTFESAATESGNNPANGCHGEKNRECKNQQELAAETNGFSVASQISHSYQRPDRPCPPLLTPVV